MEWAPRYAQGPNALADVYVPARGATAATATATPRRRRRAATTDRGQRQPGLARRVDRQRAQQHRRRRWCRSAPSRASASARRRPRSATRTASWRRRSRSTSPRARRSTTPAARSSRPRPTSAMPTNVRGAFQGTALRGAAVAGPAGDADRRRDRRDLHRARHALREPGPSDHGAVDAAVGRRRRGARAAAVPHGLLDHRPDRRVPADRHRQEERDPDHRLRARGRAHARPLGASRRCARPACCASGRS